MLKSSVGPLLDSLTEESPPLPPPRARQFSNGVYRGPRFPPAPPPKVSVAPLKIGHMPLYADIFGKERLNTYHFGKNVMDGRSIASDWKLQAKFRTTL